jgi:hypothetical protein
MLLAQSVAAHVNNHHSVNQGEHQLECLIYLRAGWAEQGRFWLEGGVCSGGFSVAEYAERLLEMKVRG